MADLSFLDPSMNSTDETPMGAVSPDLSFLDPDQGVKPADPSALINARELTHGMDPQRTAKVIDLSRKAGLPPRIVEERMDEIERREMLNDGLLADVASKAPKTTSFLSDPDRFAVAQTDIENLAELERLIATGPVDSFAMSGLVPRAEDNKLAKELIADPAMALVKGGLKAPGTLAELGLNLFSLVPGAIDSATRGLEQITGMPRGGYFGELRDAALGASKWIRENYLDAEPLQISEDLRGKGAWDNPEIMLDPEWVTYVTADVLPSLIATLGAYAAGGPVAAGVVGGGMEAGGLYQELLDEGMEDWKANTASQVYGVLSGALNAFGADKVLGKGVATFWAKRLVKGFFVKGATEGATEWAEEPIQALVAGIARGDSVAADIVEATQKGFDVFLPSLITGGLAGTATERMEYQKAQFAAKEQEVLDMLTENVAQSNLAQLDPVLYQEALTVLKEGGKISDIHIPASAIMSYNLAEVSEVLNQLGVSFETFDLALNSGDTVAIPVEKYGAAIAANPDLAVRFANDRKLSADGYTRNELAQFNQEWAQEAKRVLQLAAETEELKDQEDAETKAIYEQVYAARQAAGRVPDAARLDAAQFTAALVSMAKMSGGKYTPAQLFEAYMPQVTAGQTTVDQQALQQDAAYAGVENQVEIEEAGRLWAEMGTESPYFKRWFGNTPLLDEDGAPIAVYHWSQSPTRFEAFDLKRAKEGFHFGSWGQAQDRADQVLDDGSGGDGGTYFKTYLRGERMFTIQDSEENDPYSVAMQLLDQGAISQEDFRKVQYASDMEKDFAAVFGREPKTPQEELADILGDNTIIRYENKHEGGYAGDYSYAVFNPTQIKSATGNRGTFDPADARVQYQALSPEAQAMADKIAQSLQQDETGPTPDAEVVGSPTFYQVQNLPEWKTKTQAWMEKNGYTPQEIDKHLGAIEGQMRIFSALGPMELEMLPKGAGLNPRARVKGVQTEGPIRSNTDPIYKITFDASAMCVKRLEAAATANYVQAQIGRALTTSERMALVALFRSAGKAAPCIYCYVEAPRAKSGEFVKTATDVVFGVQETPKHTSGKKKGQEKWSAATLSKARAAQEEARALGLSPTDVDPNVLLDPEYAQTEEAKAKEAAAPAIYKFLRSQQLNAKPNLPKLYEEYDGQILGLPQELLDELNGYAGLRFFSSSDFQAEHVADLMQAVFDMEIRQAKAHAYTKVPDFVRIFGGTGIKIQTSVFAKEVNGEIVMDDWQGMNWDDAKAFREQYDNVGTVLVATSDAIVLWAKQQDWIDYIIPFHWSGLEKKFYTSMDWQDFTSTQTEQPMVPGETIKKIRMHETGSAAGISNEQGTRNYLTLAMERGIVPVFPAFLFKDFQPTGDRTLDAKNAKARWELMAKSGEIDWDMIDPQYYKLRKDYARTDTPFQAVQANVDVNMAEDILNKFLAGETPRAQVDQMIAERLMGMIRESETTGADIGVDALKRVKEGQTLFQQQADAQNILQAIGSADTSLNQVASTFKHKAFKPVDRNLDIGGGRWSAATDFLAERGVENNVFDPYNRDAAHNEAIIGRLVGGEKFPTVTVNNVLNVIAEQSVRENVVKQAAKAVEPGGTSYFLIYEGNGKGEGKVTSKGWQNNAKAKEYLAEVGKHFSEVKTSGNLIIATGPKDIDGPAVWDVGPEGQGRTLFQQQSPLGFVSAVETAITGMDFKAMPGKDLANRIKKTGGVKAEELEDLGLIDWLDGAGKVTKDQVLEFIRQGGPQIEEVVKGKPRRVTAEERAVYEELTTRGWDTLSEEERAVHDDLWERMGSRNRDTSKFSQYTMPGGENYREVLMTLPRRLVPDGEGDVQWNRNSYESSHWGEPNVLAHFRLNDRTGPNGEKVLFIEEIQSDWHQEGRKKGYRVTQKPYTLRDNYSRGTWDVMDHEGNRVESYQSQAEAQAAINASKVPTSGAPNAPFKKSWAMLAMKRILRMAAEQGYDSVAWTPGDVQAERYDLSKQVEGVEYQKNADETYDLVIKVDDNHDDMHHGGLTPSQIEDLLGKEVAEKIVSGEYAQGEFSDGAEYGELENIDLKVGGEGMKGFYDKILPAEVNKYAKKWGVKAAPSTVSDQQVWTLPITDQMRQDILQGQPLYQKQAGPQASFTFKTKSGRPLIELFRTANQSSFLHETGHLYLEMVRELALQENAPAPVTALWAQTKAALKIDDGPISREAHEEWARNLEAYFLEGAAPSLGLRKIFAQYAQWLRSIYKQVEQIFLQSGTQFNEDLKPVFDRIFASEKDIEEARSFYSSQKPFFAALDPKVMAKEREKYEERRMRARESMEDKRLRQLTEAWVKVSGGKGKIRAEVAEEVKARPVMAVIKAAAAGIDMKALDATVGEDLRKQLKAIGRYSSLVKKEGTVDPDILAAENGYDSAVAMVEDLISFPGEKAAITAGVEARMEAERQRISRGLAETDLAADEAYHNDDQLAVLVAEFEILSQQAAQKTKRLEASMVRDVAKQLLASEKVNFATQSSRFARLERRAAKLARAAYERGDAKAAADYKRQEMLNHAMFIESVKLKDGIKKTAARIKRGIQKTKGISPEVKTLLQGLGIQYGILPYKKERDTVRAFEMWNQDLVAKGGNIPTLEGWVEEMRKLGISAPLDPFLNNAAAVPYQQITVGQFRALEEGVRILRRVDRGLHTVTWIDGSTITMEEAIERLQAHVAGRGGKAPDPLTYDPNAVTLAARNFFAEHTKASTIIQALDNWEAGGLFYQLIYRPVMDADSDLSARWATEAPKIKALFEPIRRQLRKKVVVLGKARPRAQLVAAALNVGNQGNRERLIAGLGINEAQLDQLLAPLTTEEMDFVQAVWDYIATFKDEAFAVERRLTGREPAAVDPVPFEFKGKTYAGGYYPVSYDKNLRDQKGEARDAKEALDELFGGTPAGTAMTAHGHLEARASAGTGERLSQELSVISDHVAQVLRDITHREAVVNVAKLLKNKQIMAMITDVVGREKAKQLWPWLVSVSKEGREQIQLTAVEKMLLHFRPAMTFYTQAYKVGTALMQAAGFLQVFEFVQAKHVGQAVWQLYGKGLLSLNMFSDGEIISHPLIKEIREKSPQMNERLLNADRDIRDATKEFSTSESALATYKKAGFKATVAMQFYVADVVAWQGAYLQAMTDGMTEKDAINRADFVVEQAMGAGYTRALSKIQRGGSIQRFLTMFYTFGSVLYNLAARRAGITKKQLASGQYGAAALGASSFLVLQWAMPVLLEALVRGDVADDDDDETLAEKLLVNLLTYPAQSVLIARELSGIAKGFKYRFSPALKPFESVGQWISSVARAIEQEDAGIAAKPTAQLVGTTTGLIPAQFINSGEVLTGYLTGEDQELSVKELLYGKGGRK